MKRWLLEASIRHRRRALLLLGERPSAVTSTLTSSASSFTADGSTATTLTYTAKNADNVGMAGVPWTATVTRTTVDADESVITTSATIMTADGVDSVTVYITVAAEAEDGSGEPIPLVGVPASAIVVSVSGSNNTITQPSSPTDASGATTASFVTTSNGSKTVSVTVHGLALTGSAVVVAGGSLSGDGLFFQDDFAGTVRNPSGGFTYNSTGSRVSVVSFDGYDCLRFRYGPDATGADSSAEQRFNMGRQVPHLWLEYDLHIPSNFAHRNDSPNNNKFAMFWRDTYSDVAGGTWRIGHEYTRAGAASSNIRAMSSRWDLNSWTDAGYTPTGQGDLFIDAAGPLVIGDWNQVRIEMAAASAYGASDGIHRIWINGTLFLETTTGKFWNYPTGSEPADCYLQNGYWMGWANSGFAAETDFHIKAVKFYNEDPAW